VRFAVSLLSLRPGRVGGAEIYVRELLRHLAAEAGGDEIVAVAPREVADGLDAPGVERRVVSWGDAAVVAARIAEAFTPYHARAAERAFEAIGADATLFPQQSVFPRRVPGPVVLTVHDVQHLYHPENFGAFDRAYRPAIYPYSLERADRVIAISGFTRRTLVERCAVPPEKIEVVPLGFAPPPPRAALEPLPAAGPSYLYYPAATFAHKDHETLLRTYAALRRGGAIGERLVLSGQRTRAWERLAKLARALGVGDDVVHLGFLPRADVERLYAFASAVVFPSRYEGFGLPVVEAASRGQRVIARPLPVYEEVGLGPEWQIDFGDPDQLLAALRRPGPTVLARPPGTWAECARRTVGVLRGAARAPGLRDGPSSDPASDARSTR
jgi:glycosyltransferase involved in cell wall biosynthesis